jgi:hypothetical protein
MTRRVIVIGGSDQGRQVVDVIEGVGAAEVVGVLDRRGVAGDQVVGYPVLGSDEELATTAASTGATAFVVAIGENFARHRVLTREMAVSDLSLYHRPSGGSCRPGRRHRAGRHRPRGRRREQRLPTRCRYSARHTRLTRSRLCPG